MLVQIPVHRTESVHHHHLSQIDLNHRITKLPPISSDTWSMNRSCRTEEDEQTAVHLTNSRSLIHEYWNKTLHDWIILMNLCVRLLLQITDSWVLEQNTAELNHSHESLCSPASPDHWFMSTGTKHCRTESFSWIFVFTCFSRSLIHEYWNKTLHDWIILMNLCVHLLLQITDSWVLEQNTAELNHSHESLCSPASPDHWFMSTGTKHCRTESFSWIFVFTCFSRSLIHEYWNKTLHDWIILMNLCVHLLLQITDSWVLEQNTARLNHSHESLCSPASPDHWFMSTGTKHCRTESFSWIFVFTCFSRSLIHEYWNKTLQNWIILMNLCVHLLLQITDSWVLEQNTARLNHSHESFQHISPALCSPASPDHWFMSTGTKHCRTESFSWIFVFACFSRSLIHEYWNKTLHDWIILMNLCVHLLLQITDSWVLEQNTARLNHSHESLCSPASPYHWFMSTGTKHCTTESFSWIFVFTCFSRSLIHEYWNKTLHDWIILMNLCVRLLLQITDSWVLEQNTARLNHSRESLCSPASPDHWFMSTGTKHCRTESFSWIFVFACFSRSLIHEYWNKTLQNWIILMNLCVHLLLQITDSWVLEQNTARLNHSHESLCSPASPDHWFMSTGTKHCRTESFSWIFVFACFSRSLIHEYWNKTLHDWIILMNLCVHLLLQITDSWVLKQNTAELNHSHESLCSPASPDHWFMSTGTKHCTTESFSWIFVFTCFSRSLIHEYWNKTLHDWIILVNLCVHLLLQITDSWILEQNTARLNHSHESLCSPASPDHWFMSTGTKHCRTESFSWIFVFTCFSRSLIHEYWKKTLQNWIILMNLCVHLLLQITDSWVLEQNTAELNHSHESLCSPASPDHWFMSTGTKHCTTESFSWIFSTHFTCFVFTCFSRSLIHEYWNKTLQNWIILMNLCVRLLLQITDSWVLEQNTARLNHSHESLCSPASPDHWFMSTGTKHCTTESFSWIFVFTCFSRSLIHEYWNKTLHDWIILMNLCVRLLLQITDSWVLEQNTARLNHSRESLCSPASPDHWFMSTGTKHCRTESFSWIFVFACFSRSLIHEYWNKTLQNWIILMNLCVHLLLQITDSWVLEQNTARLNHSHESLCSPASPDHWFMSTGTKHCRTESFSWIFVFACFSRSLIHEYWNKTLHDWIILMNLCVHLLLQITDSWVLEQNTARLNHSHESLCSPASPDHWFMSTGTKHCTTESFSWIFVFACFSRSLIHEYWNKTLQNWIILMNLCVRLLLQITDSWVLEQNTARLNHSHESLCSPASPDHWFMSTGTKHCRTESFSWIFVFACFSRSLIHEYWNKTLHDWIILMNLCVHLLLQITDSWVLEQNTARLNHSHESLCSPASPDHWFMSSGTKHCRTESFSWIFVFTCFSRSLIHEYWNKTLHDWIILMNLCVHLLLQITDSWVLEQNTAELNHSHESLCSPASPDHWFMSSGTKHCRTESFSWIFVFTCFSRSLIHEYWNKTLHDWIILMNLCVHLLLQITDSWVLEQNTAELNHSHESLCSSASPDHWFMSTGTKHCRTESFSRIFVFICFSRSLIHEYWNKTLQNWIILMNLFNTFHLLCVRLLLQITDSWVLEQNTAELNHSHESLCSPASPDHWFMSTGTKHCTTESFSWIFVFACFSRSLIHEYWNKTLHDWIILMNLCVHLLLQITDSWVLEQNTTELNHSHESLCSPASPDHWFMNTGTKHCTTESFSWIFVFTCFSRSLIHEYWNKTLQNWIILMNLCVRLLLQITDSWILEQNTARLNHSHESLCSPASPDHWFMNTGTKHCTTESFSWIFVFTCFSRSLIHEYWNKTLHDWIILMNLCVRLLLQITDSWVLEQNTARLNHSHESLCLPASPDHWFMNTGTKHCTTESFSWIFVFACFSRSLIHEYWNKTLQNWIILMNLCVRLLLQITDSWVLEQNTAELNHSHESLCSPASPDHWIMSTGTKHCTTESFSWIFVFTCFSRSLIHEYWNKTLQNWIILMNLFNTFHLFCVHLLLLITVFTLTITLYRLIQLDTTIISQIFITKCTDTFNNFNRIR